MHGRDLKNKAMEYLDEARTGAPNTADAGRAGGAARQERGAGGRHPARIKDRAAESSPRRASDRFDDMNLEQLREYITTNTGQAPHGSIEPQDPDAAGA